MSTVITLGVFGVVTTFVVGCLREGRTARHR